MSENFGISHGGKSAEDAFIELTGATRATRASFGDAVLDGTPIEIKRATASTLNQVRAIKYIPLVVYYAPTDDWYVVPAHVVVAAVSKKARGQHTENPFESATLSINDLSPYKVMDPSQLSARTRAAVEESAQFPEVKNLMDSILNESKGLAAHSIARVRVLLRQLGLGA